MIYKYLTHPLYCHMTLTLGDLGAGRIDELSICQFDYD